MYCAKQVIKRKYMYMEQLKLGKNSSSVKMPTQPPLLLNQKYPYIVLSPIVYLSLGG